MAQEPETLVRKSNGVLRDLASHQGAAYREYGDALEKFGNGEIGAGHLLKSSGDLYFKEWSRVSVSVFDALSDAFTWSLDKLGVETLDRKKTARPRSGST